MATNLSNTALPAPAPKADEKMYVTYRDFNTTCFDARVQHVELKSNERGEFVAVTCITNLKDGEKGVAIRFTSSNGILKLAKGGHLMPGRQVKLTGSIVEFANAYTNDEGVVVALDRPRIQLGEVQMRLGAKPRSANTANA